MNTIMKAALLESFGSPLVITEVERPALKENEVLVKIKASGINPLDLKIRVGQAAHAKRQVPAILGIDIAGVVEAVGSSVQKFKLGDEVYGMAGGIGDVQGSLAEYAASDADLLAKKPANLTMEEAAALPLIFITAWEALVDKAHIDASKTVLIHGGAGGVGHVAIQIAKANGSIVYATGSAEQKQIIESYGAIAIDYKAMPVEQYVKEYTNDEGFDIVLDTVGGTNLDASFKAAKYYTGQVVSILGWGTHSLAPLSFRAGTYSGVFTLLPLLTGKGRAHHGDIMEAAAKLAESGRLKVNLDPNRFTFEQVNEAFKLMEDGKARGKVVVTIQE